MTQLEIMIDMQNKGYNVVTCPTECGAVLLVLRGDVDEKITCEYCEFTSIPNDFSDLVY
tara:strand:- start:44 stop:220 length:177 start_codon:yes stop_codon:yes gene_type:complete